MDDNTLMRVAFSAARQCYSLDPAISMEDMIQTAAAAVLAQQEDNAGFAFLVAINGIRDMLRSSQVVRRLRQGRVDGDLHPTRQMGPLEMLIREEEKEIIIECPALTDRQRFVLLEILKGNSPSDIVRDHGMSHGAVANHVKDGVNRVRAHCGMPVLKSVRLGRGRGTGKRT